MGFEYLSPTKIVFGNKKFNDLGKIARGYGNQTLIITGKRAMREQGYLEKAIKNLKSFVFPVVFEGISQNPRASEINEAIEMARVNECNLIIGLGGGSAIDAAKAVSVGMDYNSIEDIIGKTLEYNKISLPVIAIPTTAGSGAEVTKGAIITNIEKEFKSGIRGEALFPDVAIIDPLLTHSLPAKVTAETGFDALTHVIESYIAKKANLITDMYAEKAMGLIAQNLEKVITNPYDIQARENMCLASVFGGLNIANASSCAPHRLQQAMGSILPDISHGAGLAAVYPTWLEKVRPYEKDKFEKIDGIFQKEGYSSITNFMEKIKVNYSLEDLGVKDRGMIDCFLDKISGNVENDPIENLDKEMMKSIYEASF